MYVAKTYNDYTRNRSRTYCTFTIIQRNLFQISDMELFQHISQWKSFSAHLNDAKKIFDNIRIRVIDILSNFCSKCCFYFPSYSTLLEWMLSGPSSRFANISIVNFENDIRILNPSIQCPQISSIMANDGELMIGYLGIIYWNICIIL